MSFRNAVILSLCLAAGMGTLSGCAYTDKYVEIVLVDPGGQPERLTSHSKSNMPADTVNPANSVCAQDNGAYDGTVDDGTVKEEKKPEEPKKPPKPSATPEATPSPVPTATPMPTATPLPTPKPTPTAEWTPRPTSTPQPTADAAGVRYEEEIKMENDRHDDSITEINQRHGKDMANAQQYLNMLLEEPSDEQEYYDALEQAQSNMAKVQADLDAELAQEKARHEQAVKDIKAKYSKQ